MTATQNPSTGTIPAHKADEYAALEALGYRVATEHPCPSRTTSDGQPWTGRETCGAATIAPKEEGEEGYYCPTCGMTSA